MRPVIVSTAVGLLALVVGLVLGWRHPLQAEADLGQGVGRLDNSTSSSGRDSGQGGTPVRGVGDPVHQAIDLQTVDSVGDAGRVDLEPVADLAQGQRPLTAERQEGQGFEPAKGEAERLKGGIDPP